MGVIPEFNEDGKLPPGIIKTKMSEFKDRFVIGKSPKRLELFKKYKEYARLLKSANIGTVQWIDGSYTTSKPEPGDIDLITHVDINDLEQDDELYQTVLRLASKEESERIHSLLSCHTFFITMRPKGHADYQKYVDVYNYWFDTFGHDYDKARQIRGMPKGIIEFNIRDDEYNNELNIKDE